MCKKIQINDFDYILEPSAGKGSFFNLLPKEKRIGLDIDPKCKDLIKMDFFEYEPKHEKTYLTIGNPPFGRVSNLAIKFFNKSCEFSKVIAFIVPRTFKRTSVQNKLNLNFHLIFNHDLPTKTCCFEPRMEAKCCFQIWERKSIARKIVELVTTHNHFEFLKLKERNDKNQPIKPNGADFVMKAYGSNCGQLVEEQNVIAPKNYHWIKSKIDKSILKERFQCINYDISKDTVRQDSLGKQDLILLYTLKYGS